MVGCSKYKWQPNMRKIKRLVRKPNKPLIILELVMGLELATG